MNLKMIVILILIILSLIVVVQNTEIVTLQLLFWTISMSRIIFIPFLLLVGFVLGYIVANLAAKKK